MHKRFSPFLTGFLSCFLSFFLALSATTGIAHATSEMTSGNSPENHAPDSLSMEKDLQNLSWPQFKSVVEAIPKLKADIEAYGAFGWQFVQSNYTRYAWKKKIDRLDENQKKLLGELIANAHKKIPAMSGSGD